MKKMLRITALLLCFCVLTLSLSSCLAFFRIVDVMDRTENEISSEVEEPTKDDLSDHSLLQFTLSEADREAFADALALCRELTLAGTDTEAIDAAWDALEDQYYHIATQAQIAYILYCVDQKDEALSEAYLYASEMSGDVYTDYMELCREIDTSASPYRDQFFSDWTEEELADMRRYSKELADLQEANDRILVAYRELDDEAFEDGAAEYYLQLAENLNRIAQLQDCEDYYTYAYEKLYLRDYGAAQTEALRTYTAEYLFPLYLQLYEDFYNGYNKLSRAERTLFEQLSLADYDALSVNYVDRYLQILPESVGSAMQDLFLSDHAIFADGKNAYQGAFTGTLHEYGQAVCYFGPGYQSSFTVVHELGHYYAAQYTAEEDLLLDLAEVQSQGNEMLFLTSLEGQISQELYEVLSDYHLCNTLTTVIMCVVIDEFEMLVYQNLDRITEPTTQLDRIMDHVLERYGGTERFTSTVGDAYSYWRRVTTESPVYYISYAVSAVASVKLYAEAVNDLNTASEIYRCMVEEIVPEDTFLTVLARAGLGDPFDETTYLTIADAIAGR